MNNDGSEQMQREVVRLAQGLAIHDMLIRGSEGHGLADISE